MVKKVSKSNIFKKISFLRHEVPFKAKNNREAVVVCAIHVVKRYLISTYKNYLIYRQSEKRLHLKDEQFAFSVQKTGDFDSDPTL